MGVLDAKDQFEKDLKPGMAVTAPKRVRKRAPAPAEPSEPRRSLRARPEVAQNAIDNNLMSIYPGHAQTTLSQILLTSLCQSCFLTPALYDCCNDNLCASCAVLFMPGNSNVPLQRCEGMWSLPKEICL